MPHVIKEDTKENKEPLVSILSACAQTINKKTLMADMPDTMLYKINPIPSTPSKVSSTN